MTRPTLIRIVSYTLVATAVFVSVLILIQAASLFVGSLVFAATGSNILAAISTVIFSMIPLCLMVAGSLKH